jgi:hypothetical protein
MGSETGIWLLFFNINYFNIGANSRNKKRRVTEIDAAQSPVEPVNRQVVQHGCNKYNFCIIVPRGTLKSGTRNLKLFDRRHGRVVHAQPTGPAGNKALMTSLAPQMMVKLGCLRSLCAVDGLLNNSMSSDDLERCSVAAPLCLEPHCVLDAPLYLSLKVRQGNPWPPDCARLVAALRALLSANHFPMMVNCAKAACRLSCPQWPC